MDTNGGPKRRYENTMPVTDEGWWESVLAEERRYSSHVSRPQQVTQKTISPAPKKQESTQPEVAVHVDWERIKGLYRDDRILSIVLSYGAFARLEVGIEGLIHATEMPLESGQTPRDSFTEGQKIQVRILHVDPAHQRMGLSLQTSL